MDKFDNLLTKIITKIQSSNLSDEKKANIYSEISAGLYKIVWPIVINYIPKEKIASIESQSQLTIKQYTDLIESALHDPNMPKELYNCATEALTEIETLLNKENMPQVS